jgi:hypothetical protein
MDNKKGEIKTGIFSVIKNGKRQAENIHILNENERETEFLK